MEHCPRKENIVADLLRRQHPGKDWEKEKDITQITINVLKCECSRELGDDLQNIRQLQREDTQIHRIVQTLKKSKEHNSRFVINKEILYQKTPETN